MKLSRKTAKSYLERRSWSTALLVLLLDWVGAERSEGWVVGGVRLVISVMKAIRGYRYFQTWWSGYVSTMVVVKTR
jgi:hypothetical protein